MLWRSTGIDSINDGSIFGTALIIPETPLDYSFYLIDDVTVSLGNCPNAEAVKTTLTLGNVMFEYHSWQITEDGRRAIKEFLSQLGKQIERLQIIGHTDGVGSEAYNLQLSDKRAEAVRDAFVELGVPADVIEHEGLGAKELIAEPTSAENRRVEITME